MHEDQTSCLSLSLRCCSNSSSRSDSSESTDPSTNCSPPPPEPLPELEPPPLPLPPPEELDHHDVLVRVHVDHGRHLVDHGRALDWRPVPPTRCTEPTTLEASMSTPRPPCPNKHPFAHPAWPGHRRFDSPAETVEAATRPRTESKQYDLAA